MSEWETSEKVIHYCPDTRQYRSKGIRTYETACGRFFLPQWIVTDPEETNCLDCLDAIHGKVKAHEA